jgi:hypothetical protein
MTLPIDKQSLEAILASLDFSNRLNRSFHILLLVEPVDILLGTE